MASNTSSEGTAAHAAAVEDVAIRACPALGAVALETDTVVVADFNPLVAVEVAEFPPIERLVTGVVDVTVKGAVPVATVEINALAVESPETDGDVVYVGAAVDPVALPSTVLAAAVAKVPVTVPDVVTAEEGVAESTVPSPVNVTEVTLPVPVPGSPDKLIVHDANVPEPRFCVALITRTPVVLL